MISMLWLLALCFGDPGGGAAADTVRAAEVQAEPAYQSALSAAKSDDNTRTLDAIDAALRAGASPTRILAESAFADLHVEERFHALIREYARQGPIVLVTPDEPGPTMVVSGVVKDVAGRPIESALVHVFHADVKGEYTPAKPMDEPHSRIFGCLRTDAEGWYQFRTVRPGGYQKPVTLDGKERFIPQHIHFEVSADGFETSRFQMVFDDDPRMDDHWRHSWAPAVKAPIVRVARDPAGRESCELDIALRRSGRE